MFLGFSATVIFLLTSQSLQGKTWLTSIGPTTSFQFSTPKYLKLIPEHDPSNGYKQMGRKDQKSLEYSGSLGSYGQTSTVNHWNLPSPNHGQSMLILDTKQKQILGWFEHISTSISFCIHLSDDIPKFPNLTSSAILE